MEKGSINLLEEAMMVDHIKSLTEVDAEKASAEGWLRSVEPSSHISG